MGPEHHPTDILGSLLFAALWLTATTLLIKPSADEPAHSPAAAGEPEPRLMAGPFGRKIT